MSVHVARHLPRSPSLGPADRRAIVLAMLGGLFLLRVVGQVLVTYTGAGWLPDVEQWQSGLLPYPVLLASQAGILVALAIIVRDAWRGRGRSVVPRPRLGCLARWLGVAYAGSMVARYAITMTLHPEWRWTGHTNPIIFHGVLATFVIVYGGVLLGEGHGSRSRGFRSSLT